MELHAAECHRTVEWFGLEGASSSSSHPLWAGYHAYLFCHLLFLHTNSLSDLQTGLRTGVGEGDVTAHLNSCYRITEWVRLGGTSVRHLSRLKQSSQGTWHRICIRTVLEYLQ